MSFQSDAGIVAGEKLPKFCTRVEETLTHFLFMYKRRIRDYVVLTIPEGIAALELVGLQSKINFIPFTNKLLAATC